ncbi:MAG: hypothetical protein AAF401_02715 [Pseudomonadota bacterium]
MQAAAMLDPDAGCIVGFVGAEGNRPGGVILQLNDGVTREVPSLGPPELLGRNVIATLGPPPTAVSTFSCRLPRAAMTVDSPLQLTVTATPSGDELLKHDFQSRAEVARYTEGCAMAESIELKITRLDGGVFTGRMTLAGGGSAPLVGLRLKGEPIGEAALERDGDGYRLTASLPPSAVGDGVSIVEFVVDDDVVARYPISAGEALAGDIMSEVASLRAELDQLKRAFRQTLAGGVIARDERPMIIAEVLTHVDSLLEVRDRSRVAEEIELADDEEDWDVET